MDAECVYDSLSEITPPQFSEDSRQENVMPVPYSVEECVSPTVDAEAKYEVHGLAEITTPHSQSFGIEEVHGVEAFYDDFNMSEVSSVVEVEQSRYVGEECISVSDEVAPLVVSAVCPKPPSIYLHSQV
ncbi:MAG TPA: hypothetical protein VGO47_11475 [Chlamydiales bacterium]|jgi:hypothetical protein|nr:hypothetical protein [Chlamydiales bacterium]